MGQAHKTLHNLPNIPEAKAQPKRTPNYPQHIDALLREARSPFELANAMRGRGQMWCLGLATTFLAARDAPKPAICGQFLVLQPKPEKLRPGTALGLAAANTRWRPRHCQMHDGFNSTHPTIKMCLMATF